MKMKALILAAILTAPTAIKAEEDVCAAMGEMAAAIMLNRQNGTVMSELMAVVGSTPEMPAPLLSVARAIIMDAYEKPQFSDPGNRENAVTGFRNEVEVACYGAL